MEDSFREFCEFMPTDKAKGEVLQSILKMKRGFILKKYG